MNSNREERLQMRQRGAATRKPKEVDFGFSFGGFGAAIDAPPAQQQPQAQAQPAGIVEPPTPTTNSSKALPSSPTTRPLGSQEQAAIQRTPGSARNARPARPSMFDIPDEEEEPPGSVRSFKRRKIETPTKVSRKPSTGLDKRRDEGARPAEPRQDGAATSVMEKPGEVSGVPPAVGQVEEQPSTEVHVSAPSVPDVKGLPHEVSKVNGDSHPEVAEAPSQEASQEAPVQAQPAEAPVEAPVEAPPETTKAPQQQEAPAAETAPPETSPTQAQEVQEPKRTTPPRQDTKAKRKKRELQETQTRATETAETAQVKAPQEQEPERTTPPRQAKRKKREPSAAQKTQAAEAAETAPAQEPQEPKRATPPRQAKGKQKRGESQEDQALPENVAVPEPTEQAQEPTQPPESQGPAEEAPISKPKDKRQTGQPPASAQAPSDKGKSSDKGKKPKEKPVPDGAPVRDESRRERRGREDKARNPFKETTDEKATQPVDRPQKDDATESRSQKPSPETKARKRAGRPKKTARPEEEEKEAEPAQPGPSAPTRGGGGGGDDDDDPDGKATTQPAEQENREEPTRAPARRRITRNRGETVPVTVHRLVNIHSLGSRPDDSDTDSSSEESADELSTRQKTKLPNRGGVNQADVLNQICRETLEKTLTTLKNGIAEETNVARKAEWTRKKKVVETYGTELEGRLLEMSEMLDSNFVLGVKLKRAKREMMEMRSRLYHVRREREAIAVQMDIVRRKHGEEERARVARTDVNNTLHSLELAVHRSQQHRPDEEGSTAAGLEYLVRTVAEQVSSRGHGQGGLLRQIQSFNAELEAVARRLEG